MGGPFSGRYPWSLRLFADEVARLDVADIARCHPGATVLWPVRRGQAPAGVAVVAELATDHVTIGVLRVPLVLVALAVGPPRLFAQCPRCGLRCRILFGTENTWACRACTRVRWCSQHRPPAERAAGTVTRAWTALAPFSAAWRERPRGRHRRRHARLVGDVEAAHAAWREERRRQVEALVATWKLMAPSAS